MASRCILDDELRCALQQPVKYALVPVNKCRIKVINQRDMQFCAILSITVAL